MEKIERSFTGKSALQILPEKEFQGTVGHAGLHLSTDEEMHVRKIHNIPE